MLCATNRGGYIWNSASALTPFLLTLLKILLTILFCNRKKSKWTLDCPVQGHQIRNLDESREICASMQIAACIEFLCSGLDFGQDTIGLQLQCLIKLCDCCNWVLFERSAVRDSPRGERRLSQSNDLRNRKAFASLFNVSKCILKKWSMKIDLFEGLTTLPI